MLIYNVFRFGESFIRSPLQSILAFWRVNAPELFSKGVLFFLKPSSPELFQIVLWNDFFFL